MKNLCATIIIILIICLAFLVWRCWFQETAIPLTQPKEELAKAYSVFEIKAAPITVLETMLVYKTLPPSTDISTAKRFCETFRVKGDIVDKEKYYFAKEGQKEVEIFKEAGTGLMKYTDFSRFGLEKNIPSLPSPEEALSICRKFLGENVHLSTGNELYAGSQYFEFVHFDNSGKELEKGRSSISVGFKYKIGDIPVEGPGAKTTITVGENSHIIEYVKMWRDMEPYRKMKTIDADTALTEFKGMWAPEASCRQREQAKLLTTVIIENIYLAYLTRTGSKPQKFIEPVYVFQGFCRIEGEYQGRKIRSSEPFKFTIRAIKDIVE